MEAEGGQDDEERWRQREDKEREGRNGVGTTVYRAAWLTYIMHYYFPFIIFLYLNVFSYCRQISLESNPNSPLSPSSSTDQQPTSNANINDSNPFKNTVSRSY